MKCLHRAFVKNGEGEVKLVPEEGAWQERVCDWLCQDGFAYSHMLRCAGRDLCVRQGSREGICASIDGTYMQPLPNCHARTLSLS